MTQIEMILKTMELYKRANGMMAYAPSTSVMNKFPNTCWEPALIDCVEVSACHESYCYYLQQTPIMNGIVSVFKKSEILDKNDDIMKLGNKKALILPLIGDSFSKFEFLYSASINTKHHNKIVENFYNFYNLNGYGFFLDKGGFFKTYSICRI